MATGFTTLDALNGITKAGMKEDKPTAKFRTKDISIFIHEPTRNRCLSWFR